jgi:Undecaprenyl-phosphate glucose phosphotransferase
MPPRIFVDLGSSPPNNPEHLIAPVLRGRKRQGRSKAKIFLGIDAVVPWFGAVFRCGYFVLSHLAVIDLPIILAFYPPKFQQLNGEYMLRRSANLPYFYGHCHWNITGISEATLIPHSSGTTGLEEKFIASQTVASDPMFGPLAAGLHELPRYDGRTTVGFTPKKSKIKIPHAALQHFLAFADSILIVIASIVGGETYQFVENGDFSNLEPLFGAGVIAALLYVLIGQTSGFYDFRTVFSKRWDFGRIFAYWSLVSLLLAFFAFLMKIGPVFSRGSIVCFGLLALACLLGCRGLSKRLVASAVADGQVQGRRAILLGTRDELATVDIDELLERFGLSEIARVEFSGEKNKNLALTESEASSLDGAVAVARERGVDEIVLAFPWNDTRKLELIRDRLRASPLPVELLPDCRIRSLAENPSFRLRRSLSIEIQRGPLSSGEQFSKRLMDVAGALIGLTIFSPLILLSALAIKVDSAGPVVFRQRRNGFNAKQFVIFKFRTMSVMEDGTAVAQAKRSDPRVTMVGKVLRRSSIDELPQLLNVLLGDMSLVGPRPHALAHDNHYGDLVSDYAFRHHVKPGITGWAQVNGYRGETARVEQMKGRVDCDLWYINNWSLLLDLKIIARTCFELVRRRNAY